MLPISPTRADAERPQAERHTRAPGLRRYQSEGATFSRPARQEAADGRAAARMPTAAPAEPAAVAAIRELAPELLAADGPVQPGDAFVDTAGRIFAGSRCDHQALRRRLRGAPVVPCGPVNDLLAWIAVNPGADPDSLWTQAAAALVCPLSEVVPPDPAVASNGRVYSARALADARNRGTWPRSAGPRPCLDGAIPPVSEALVALIARLELRPGGTPAAFDRIRRGWSVDLDGAEGLLARIGQQDADAAGSEGTDAGGTAPSNTPRTPLSPNDAALPFSDYRQAEVPAGVMALALDYNGGTLALGRLDGSVTLLAPPSFRPTAAWVAHADAGGIAHLALTDAIVITAAAHPAAAPPHLWDHAGTLLRRLVLPAGGPLAFLGVDDYRGEVHGRTAAGDALTWRLDPNASAAPYAERALGPGGRLGIGMDGIAIYADGELEVIGDGCQASLPLATDVYGSPREVLPVGDGVLVLGADGRLRGAQIFAAPRTAYLGGVMWPADPSPLLDWDVALLAGQANRWAAASVTGKLAFGRQLTGGPLPNNYFAHPQRALAVSATWVAAINDRDVLRLFRIDEISP